MQLLNRLVCLSVLWIPSLRGSAQTDSIDRQHLSIGEVHTIHSVILQEDRILNIYTPEGFDTLQNLPVIYLLDGSINEDFIHVCGLVQFFHLMYGMPPCIVVGIANVDRKRDFTFHTDLAELTDKYPTVGHSEPFIRFLSEELQPYVREHFNTGDTNMLIGQSLGGLLATEILLKQPDLFTHYFIVSPSLWWDNESLQRRFAELSTTLQNKHLFIFISVGKDEDRIMVREARTLHKQLRSLHGNKLDLYYHPMSGENHATVLHSSLYEGLKILFPYQE